jgi:L-fuconolactonase
MPIIDSQVHAYEANTPKLLRTERLSESERATLMGGACAKAYRWSPKKG